MALTVANLMRMRKKYFQLRVYKLFPHYEQPRAQGGVTPLFNLPVTFN